jgi:D-sedoheptulose 7-phosphate isomerase
LTLLTKEQSMSASAFQSTLDEHQAVIERLAELEPAVTQAIDVCAQALERGGKVMLCGNGGSAADSQHIAAELVGRLQGERRALAAIALTTDSSALTAIANDYGYEQVFARQVAGLGRRGDVLVAISTSGQSASVLAAAECARGMGITTIALAGKGGGPLAAACALALVVPSDVTARIQEAHIVIGHALCFGIERRLGLD